MIMAFLEHTALRLGVVPRPPDASMGEHITTSDILPHTPYTTAILY